MTRATLENPTTDNATADPFPVRGLDHVQFMVGNAKQGWAVFGASRPFGNGS